MSETAVAAEPAVTQWWVNIPSSQKAAPAITLDHEKDWSARI
jgi:hypothetical protein